MLWPLQILYNILIKETFNQIVFFFSRRSIIPGQIWALKTVGLVRVIYVSEENVRYRCLELEPHMNEPEDLIFSCSKKDFLMHANQLGLDPVGLEKSNVLKFPSKDRE